MTPLPCRRCGHSNEAHTHANASIPAVPHDGDFSLCLYCGEWSVFERGALREPTSAEQKIIRDDPQCVRASHTRLLVFASGDRQ